MKLESGESSQTVNFKSMRPNPDQYSENFSDDEQELNKDTYKEYAERTPQGKDYDKIRNSFNTLHSINDLKFKPDDVEIPDSSCKKLDF